MVAKIIQIVVLNGELIALCDDGTLWRSGGPGMPWERIR